jgi:hypothetical protein
MAQEIHISGVDSVQATTGVPIRYPPIEIYLTQRFLKHHPDLSVFLLAIGPTVMNRAN